jgi:TatA/E family protein of Tat protein translocase
MGSFSISEILTILVVILVIFGPKRLPEFARKAGRLIATARQAVQSFTAELEGEYGETVQPIRELGDELGGIKKDLTKTVTTLADSAAVDDGDALGPGDVAHEPDAPQQRIEPITIDELVADVTSKGGENAGAASEAESGTDSSSLDDPAGEVA